MGAAFFFWGTFNYKFWKMRRPSAAHSATLQARVQNGRYNFLASSTGQRSFWRYLLENRLSRKNG
jgi:hypothetical protein